MSPQKPPTSRPHASLETPRSSLESRRFVFITGKGGAGKTTLTAALTLSLAARGRRVLVATSRNEQRLAELLGVRPFTPEIQSLGKNLWGVSLVPEVALREYGALVLKSQKLVTLLFDNRYAEGFFHGAPGLREWALLGKAWFHSVELGPNGAPRFDTVVFDAPATGHGVDMLRVPKVILSAAPPGRLRADAERAFESFRDPQKSAFIVVTLPEELPTNETLELVAVLRGELGLPVTEIVLNSTLEPLFTAAEADSLAPFATLEAKNDVERALSSGARRAQAERLQAACLERLAATGCPVRKIPRLVRGAGTHDAVLELGRYTT